MGSLNGDKMLMERHHDNQSRQPGRHNDGRHKPLERGVSCYKINAVYDEAANRRPRAHASRSELTALPHGVNVTLSLNLVDAVFGDNLGDESDYQPIDADFHAIIGIA